MIKKKLISLKTKGEKVNDKKADKKQFDILELKVERVERQLEKTRLKA